MSTIPFPDEIAHLEEINQKLDNALLGAEAAVQRIDKEYMDMKRYMAQYRSEIDPHEMVRNALDLREMDSSGAFAVSVREKIAKLKESPYFARIDFRAEEARETDVFYIGRFGFNHDNQLLISDWRSPIASMFYDCEVGRAGYIAPMGRIDGELTRKRQFKIKNGVLEYALESAVHIQDDVLRQELSHTSDEKMKSIIATIQKEQNQIIRNEKPGTLIIQGVAGSGKTSIALHRIAFLLYRFKDRLTAKNVAILSPNKVFGDYISNVLPELGEEPIFETGFADIAEAQLEGVMGFEADKDPLETDDTAWAERVKFKSTLSFVKLLDGFVKQIENAFAPSDYTFGRFTAKAEDIAARFRAYGKYPIKRRLPMIAEDIYARFETDNFMGEDIPKSRSILKALNKMLKIKNTLSLYKEFYRTINESKMLVMPGKKTLEWADVFPFLYLHAAYEGLREDGSIRHLVVDEMQDYTPVQYAAINRLFKCPKTILGDYGQCVHPNHAHSLEDMRELYDGAEFVQLTKSYRSTYEIISFARRIKNTGSIDAIERHGEIPEIIDCFDQPGELTRIKSAIADFSRGNYASLGIIVKTNEDAKRLYTLLMKDYDAHLITPESIHFENGINITSVPMSKGLEFDAVILPNANKDNYFSDYDRSLLYIACTRALHRLTVLYAGEISPFIESYHESRRGDY